MASNNFSDQIARFAEQSGETIDQVVTDYVVGVSQKIIERTPVGNPSLWESSAPPGYVGGTARANWVPSIGTPEQAEVNSTDQNSGNNQLLAIQNQIPGNIYYLTNNVPYIERLEYGWSTQAPNGMMRRTLREARAILKQAVDKNTDL